MLRSKRMACVVLGLMIAAGTASALEDVTVDVSVDYVGKYIWRGQVLTNDPVLQPAVTVGMDKLSLGVWGNYDTTNISGERGEFTEIDYTLDYTDALPGVEGAFFSAGAVYYSFPRALNVTSATTELYAGISMDTVLNPTATLYYDIDEADGFYASFGVSHSLDVAELGVANDMLKTVDLSATLGYGSNNYNKEYWTESTDALNDLVITASVPFELCSSTTLTASCSYVSLLDGSINNNTTGLKANQKSDYVYAGIGLSMSF